MVSRLGRLGYPSAEDREHHLGEAVVQARHDRDHHDAEDQRHYRVGAQFLTGRPDDLAQLSDDLTVEQRRSGPGAPPRRTPGGTPFLRGLTACLSRHVLTCATLYIRRPAVLRDHTCRAGGTRTPNHRFWRPGL